MAVVISEERPDSADAAGLIAELDSILEPLYPQESRHGYSVDKLLREAVAFFVVRVDGAPAGCGGVKVVGAEYGEIKRMYVRPPFRGRGLNVLRLETGIHQMEAIRLYERFGFERIKPFEPYREDPVSRCYEKRLR